MSESRITNELLERLDKLKSEEDEWWAKNGFPDTQMGDETGMATAAQIAYMQACSINGAAFRSPMARKMFTLGWLTALQDCHPDVRHAARVKHLEAFILS